MEFLELYEQSDVYVDAYVCDEEQYLLFLSVWGSESHVQQLRARLSLPTTNNDSIRRLITSNSKRIRIGDPTRLDSRVGRPLQSLFFNLTHLWIFDKATAVLDGKKRRCILLKQESESDPVFEKRLWQTAMALCPIPLLAEWNCLLDDFKQQAWIKQQTGFALSAYTLNFNDEAALVACISEHLRSGRLALPIH